MARGFEVQTFTHLNLVAYQPKRWQNIMKTLQQIKAEKQTAIDNLFNECLVFFAFSNEQFAANKTPLQEGEKYVSIGAGGYLPKGKYLTFSNGLKEIEKNFKAEMRKSKDLRRQHIAYELNNHEAYYTGDIEDTLQALGSDYTAAEVKAVFKEESKNFAY